jgi:hypothetical protein
MQALADTVIVLVALFVIVKCGACLGSICLLAARSADLSAALEKEASQEVVNELYLPLRPLHYRVTRHLKNRPRALALAQQAIRGPIVVSLGALTTLLFAEIGVSPGVLLLVLGASTAFCAGLHVVLAFEEVFIFGRRTRRLFHVRPSGTGSLAFIKSWSVTRDGNNLIGYFLLLLYMLGAGVAAFFLGLDTVDPEHFSGGVLVSLAITLLGVLVSTLLAIFVAPETPVDDFGDATPYEVKRSTDQTSSEGRRRR